MPNKPRKAVVRQPKVKLSFTLSEDKREGPLFTVRVDDFKLLQGYGFHRLSLSGSNGTEVLNKIAHRILNDRMVLGARASSSLLILSVTVLATLPRLRQLVLQAFAEAGVEVTNVPRN